MTIDWLGKRGWRVAAYLRVVGQKACSTRRGSEGLPAMRTRLRMATMKMRVSSRDDRFPFGRKVEWICLYTSAAVECCSTTPSSSRMAMPAASGISSTRSSSFRMISNASTAAGQSTRGERPTRKKGKERGGISWDERDEDEDEREEEIPGRWRFCGNRRAGR